MSVIAIPAPQKTGLWSAPERPTRTLVFATLRRHWMLIVGSTLLVPIAFYLVLMGLLVLRFGELPNYVTSYDWFGNIARIVAGTSSTSDIVKIALDEWLLEIGYMNYDYGRGVSEWSLLIIPHKVAIVAAIGAVIGLNFALLADQPPTATFLRQQVRSVRCGLMTAVGALLASLTCITLYWIICHSGPTWVVSLAILGLDLSTTWALEPLGATLSLTGGAILLLSALLTINENRATAVGSTQASTPQAGKEPAPC
jgi:hypothetical protein